MKPEIKKIIDDWKEAYFNANERLAPSAIYEHGYFYIFGFKYRVHEMEKMIDRLRERTAQKQEL